ncbi:MAG: hypothetical protein D6706_21970 [Chloroflexi bacterium]|nr:MAG: hypothetical protein D6706_21970 [Chloroflexota bacterium]
MFQTRYYLSNLSIRPNSKKGLYEFLIIYTGRGILAQAIGYVKNGRSPLAQNQAPAKTSQPGPESFVKY